MLFSEKRCPLFGHMLWKRKFAVITVTPFAAPHQAGVLETILPIQQQEFGIPITIEGQPDLLDIPGFYRKGEGNFWVALAGAEVVGTIALVDIGGRQGALRKMFVKTAHRGRDAGVAAKLLATLLAWAKGRSMAEIYLGTTAKFLAAHRFYEKNGFAEIAPEDLPGTFPRMVVDTKFYRLAL